MKPFPQIRSSLSQTHSFPNSFFASPFPTFLSRQTLLVANYGIRLDVGDNDKRLEEKEGGICIGMRKHAKEEEMQVTENAELTMPT